MPALSAADVQKVAHLANIELSETEILDVSNHLGSILEYVEVLDQVDTEQIEPLAHPIDVVNVFREDKPTEMLAREEALKNAPNTDGKYFVVPAILDAAE
ncbi:MAG: Asp-tRNA(Asn)/Glu-tRNA(Gln) amidotransferase subunit GatC [Planctomycetaceae bacterium]|nr:Asp-tRNA(Asn)/Glu-tRNA(Gln) amidotransferase subunit GatC [Planctomycetaceae bacterium]